LIFWILYQGCANILGFLWDLDLVSFHRMECVGSEYFRVSMRPGFCGFNPFDVSEFFLVIIIFLVCFKICVVVFFNVNCCICLSMMFWFRDILLCFLFGVGISLGWSFDADYWVSCGCTVCLVRLAFGRCYGFISCVIFLFVGLI
jgi:hypothetical protein